MTNFERIKKMNLLEFINFLRYIDFSGIYPIIEGHRFYTQEELIKWFNKEAQNE